MWFMKKQQFIILKVISKLLLWITLQNQLAVNSSPGWITRHLENVNYTELKGTLSWEYFSLVFVSNDCVWYCYFILRLNYLYIIILLAREDQCSFYFSCVSHSLASVIRGQVLTADGTPLIGVNVSFFHYPEYGYTITRQDGMWVCPSALSVFEVLWVSELDGRLSPSMLHFPV